ncbi:hypothetical protein TP70_09515 [Staphylococcus microti]|uniref:Putative staphylococcal protein n=1 Tax=Staphylococcus microti TaxID=569857 RepID=A0A0D6XQI7_9STAP|nr:hypothetical protein [Staphylococcus microti]KIX90113.1 hypothetical protein TP70_09515 [Staphylococcus microti]PNZ76979.1 YtxH domain-containing protein [Staphylococcus microti]SUM57778.1 putative staphylococcal protein [Staphylococcus microti]
MAKSNQVLKTMIGLGGALAAVVLSNKARRDKVKETYQNYKQDPEGYKQLAQEKASQLSMIATDEISKVKEDPKAYVETIKQDPKAFLNDKKEQLLQEEAVKSERKEDDFVGEGGGDPSQNLNESTKEVLKNKNEA